MSGSTNTNSSENGNQYGKRIKQLEGKVVELISKLNDLVIINNDITIERDDLEERVSILESFHLDIIQKEIDLEVLQYENLVKHSIKMEQEYEDNVKQINDDMEEGLLFVESNDDNIAYPRILRNNNVVYKNFDKNENKRKTMDYIHRYENSLINNENSHIEEMGRMKLSKENLKNKLLEKGVEV